MKKSNPTIKALRFLLLASLAFVLIRSFLHYEDDRVENIPNKVIRALNESNKNKILGLLDRPDLISDESIAKIIERCNLAFPNFKKRNSTLWPFIEKEYPNRKTIFSFRTQHPAEGYAFFVESSDGLKGEFFVGYPTLTSEKICSIYLYIYVPNS